VIVCDPDEDGWPDIVVANDTVRNFFFHNVPGPSGRPVRRDRAAAAAAYPDEASARRMGIDWGSIGPARAAW
jgi:hypothetical protein